MGSSPIWGATKKNYRFDIYIKLIKDFCFIVRNCNFYIEFILRNCNFFRKITLRNCKSNVCEDISYAF